MTKERLPKNKLQEYYQRLGDPLPTYTHAYADNVKIWTTTLTVHTGVQFIGNGYSKKESDENAARHALDYIRPENPIDIIFLVDAQSSTYTHLVGDIELFFTDVVYNSSNLDIDIASNIHIVQSEKTRTISFMIAFRVGQLFSSKNDTRDIIIISNDPSLDTLCNSISTTTRRCIRCSKY